MIEHATDPDTSQPELPGLLVVIAGPSGVGKGTVSRRVTERIPESEVAVSATTRPARPGEVDGRHYHFLDRPGFERRVDAGDFLEWAEYAGNLYGTPRQESLARVDGGAVVILDIEVQGAAQVRRDVPGALLVFLMPPDTDELERRLRARGTEDEATLRRRLEVGRQEMGQRHWFHHVVVNDDVERAVDEVVARIQDARGPVR